MSREAPYGEPQEHAPGQQPYGYGMPPAYGYGYGYGYGMRRRPRGSHGFGGGPRHAIETRPFFLTSEFLATVLAVVALGITAAAMDIVNARLTWILTAAMVVGYVLSRGVAKAGSRSYSVDPREDVLRGIAGRDDETQQLPPRQYAAETPGVGFAQRGYPGMASETKPFFVTSEFLGTLLATVALAITAASMPNLGARLTWILIAAMVVTYAVSRGLAKAATHSYAFDPREELLRREGGAAREPSTQPLAGRVGMQAIETKPFFVTSEFLGTVLAIIAIAISGAAIDILNVRLTWILITAMVCGYVLSRGIAKIGIKSHAVDPRELLLHRAADGGMQQQRQPASQR